MEPTQLKMSYNDFLEWTDKNRHADWVDGEVIVFIGVVESRLLSGFWLRPECLWRTDSLNLLEDFFDIRGPSEAQIEQIRRMLGD